MPIAASLRVPLSIAILACASLAQDAPRASSPDTAIVAGELAARIDHYLERCVPFGFSGSALVAKGGEVILSKGYGVADRKTGAACAPGTIYDLGSLSKQFTAAAVLALEQRGVLRVTDTLEKFFPEAPKDKRKIQIHHLLSHTAGVPRGLPNVGSRMTERAALVAAVLAAPLESDPGKRFSYSNLGYHLLGAVVEVATNEPLEDTLRKLVFEPAGLRDTGFRRDGRLEAARAARGSPEPHEPTPPGSLVENDESRFEGRVDEKLLATDGWYTWGMRGAGGVLSTTNDLWHWHRALQGDAVLGAAARKKLFTPVRDDYAYGWYVLRTSRGTTWIEHGGSTGNGFDVKFSSFPDERLVCIVLGNTSGVVPWVNQNVCKLAAGEPAELPPRTTRLQPPELEAWLGAFEGPDGERFRSFANGPEILLEAADERAFERLGGAAAGGAAKKLVERSRAIAAGFAEADFAALHAAEDPRHRLDFMEGWWQKLLQHHGPLLSARVLGASDGRGSAATVPLALEFERGSEIFKLQWSGETLAGVNIGPPYPTRIRLVPESATAAVAYDLVGKRVLARASLAASKDALELERDGKKLRLRRK